MRKLVAAIVLSGSIAVGVPAAAQAHTHHNTNPYYYVTHKQGHKVYVDVSGDGWKSKEDAIRQSKKLLKFANKYYNHCS
jgi:biopolymer transport protein ExbD